MSSTPEIDEISKLKDILFTSKLKQMNYLYIRKRQCQDYFGKNVKKKLVDQKILIMNI